MEALRRLRDAKRAARGMQVDEGGTGVLLGRGAGGDPGNAAGEPHGKADDGAAGPLAEERKKFVEQRLRKSGLSGPSTDGAEAHGSGSGTAGLTVEEEEAARTAAAAPLPTRGGDAVYALPEDVKRSLARGKAEGVSKPVSDADARRLGIDRQTLEAAKERWRAARTGDSEAAAAEEDPTQGGVLAWNTGLAEVALPVDVKLANVQATEAAKREYLRRASERVKERAEREGAGLERFSAPSFNASFASHGRAAAAQARIRSKQTLAYSIKDQLERAEALGDADAAGRLKAELAAATDELRRVTEAGGMRLVADGGRGVGADGAGSKGQSTGDGTGRAGGGHGGVGRTRATDDELARRYRRAIVRRL